VERFSPIDHASRVAEITGQVDSGESRCDAILVTNLIDVRWLTGFTGSNGWVVVRSDGITLGTDLRYRERAAAETARSGADIIAIQNAGALAERQHQLLASSKLVGLDATSTTHAAWERLSKQVSLTAVRSPIAVARQVKDAAEIERMEAAAAAADAALAEVEPMLHAAIDAPVTEADVRNELEHRMRLHGADDRSYHTIVATGPDHAARPHHEVGRRQIVSGDTIVIDVGGLVDGYHSDMTRSYVIGEPTREQRDVYELVQVAQSAGLDAVAAGVTARAVDSACRDVFAEGGFADWYLHGTGHGVGLEIHESPFHSQTSDEVIQAGNVVTVEPGLYRGGFGGFRIEDLVVVTDDGHRVITHHPKRPFAC
jgi:Xaa-Pro aminopeptidase